jgi:predicted Holliday junction resolvase-like endonuclease
LKKQPRLDWLDKIDKEHYRLDNVEERLDEKEGTLREEAREKGRRLAQIHVKKIDPVFTPRNLNPDDAKVIFHPVDYIVFNGLKNAPIRNIILLDRESEEPSHRRIQESINRVIDREKYEWQTLRVNDNGKVETE